MLTIKMKSLGGRSRPELQCVIDSILGWQVFNKTMQPGWRVKKADGGGYSMWEQPSVQAWVQECLADYFATNASVVPE